ncbi:MAG: glutamine--tRNA ligase/YqeY domain fusion protein, partial [Candidatus Competibacteraceae bacterium]|nr:glutamine--tRNA ligase/YqeY domain fusion protein [Candidatus Competibacteraceae bacterium]
LRFDDTNPLKESEEYMEAIKRDVQWLGFDWGEHLYHASDYFEQLYQWAEELIEQGLAYVDSQSAEAMRENRGTLTEPGRNSPYRDRSAAENLDLFRRMRAGEFDDGTHVLRAKIDMQSPNMNLRDPVLYRIRRATHHRTGDAWCIYPLYDFAHGQSDAIEGITHSICTLEFEAHRPLYDWLIEHLSVPSRPRQYEFSRLNLDYTVMSKRLLNTLVSENYVAGWDDPRMPTIAGMRRRGFTPASIRDFCERIGVTKQDNRIELSLLENSVREDLDRTAPRAMAVLHPLKVVIENYPADKTETFSAAMHPKNEQMGQRTIPFSREIYIEQDDFMENPPRKYFRLSPGGSVKLRYGPILDCTDVIKNDAGDVIELRCQADFSGERKVKGIIHWVSAAHGIKAEVRLYDRLFQEQNPSLDDFQAQLNPASLTVLDTAWLEPGTEQAAPATRFQFERLGYFCSDSKDHRPDRPVFNRTVTLRDTWSKIDSKKGKAS